MYVCVSFSWHLYKSVALVLYGTTALYIKECPKTVFYDHHHHCAAAAAVLVVEEAAESMAVFTDTLFTYSF